MRPNLYLTFDENKALDLLADGKSYQFVEKECAVPISGLGFFAAEIRRKTGLISLQSHKPIQDYCKKHLEALHSFGLSRDQQLLAKLWIAGNTANAIASRMQITPLEVSDLFDETLKKAGIFAQDDRAVRFQLRIYLSCFHLNNTPPTGTKEKLLRLYVEGKSFGSIAELTKHQESYVRVSIHEAISELGLLSKGRDAQRQLAEIYFRAKETLTSIGILFMDDPAF